MGANSSMRILTSSASHAMETGICFPQEVQKKKFVSTEIILFFVHRGIKSTLLGIVCLVGSWSILQSICQFDGKKVVNLVIN